MQKSDMMAKMTENRISDTTNNAQSHPANSVENGSSYFSVDNFIDRMNKRIAKVKKIVMANDGVVGNTNAVENSRV